MRIIDAQIHEPPAAVPHWDMEANPLEASILSCELAVAAMDAVGTELAVLSARPAWTRMARERHPDRFASLAVIDPDAADVEEQVAGLSDQPGICGVRVVLTWPDFDRRIAKLRSGGYANLLRALERHDVPTCFNLSGALPDAHAIAASYPGLTMILDNFGMVQPPIRTPDDPPWRRLPELLELAAYPNLHVKFIGAPALSRMAYPFGDVWPHLLQVVEAFGLDRLMWGSDFTRVRGLHTYAEAIAYLLHTDELSASDKEQLFSTTSLRTFRLAQGAGAP